MSGRRGRSLVAWVLAIGTVICLGYGPTPQAQAATDPEISASRVVIVGIPGLLWGDVASGLAPSLTELAADGALGDMTVRAARSRTCILDGWATLGAGNRARYPAPTEDVVETLPPLTAEQEALRLSALAGCGRQEQVALAGLTDVGQTVERIAQDEGTRAFGAEPGALGQAVSCSTAVGRSSAVAVSGSGAEVSVIDELPSAAQARGAALSRCPLSLVLLSDLIGTVPTVALNEQDAESGPLPDDGSGSMEPTMVHPRAQALAELDIAMSDIRSAVAALPGDTLLMVAGLSEKGVSRAQLHPLIAVHPDLPAGYLTSASTGRAPYVQLIDVAPTALRALGIDNPDSMVGSAVRWAGPTGGLETALVNLRDLNRAAVAHVGLTRTYFWTLVSLSGALVASLLLVRASGATPAGRTTRTIRTWRPAVNGSAVAMAALVFSAVPAATHLANLTPWWRSTNQEVALGVAVLACLTVVVATALVLGNDRGPIGRLLPSGPGLGPILAVAGITSLTIGVDVVLGSPMELNSLLGYNAIVAGRFVGMGNLSFGLFAACTLLVTAMLVRGSKRRMLIGIGAVGTVAVVVVGAASLGRDFGGVLALVPGFLFLGFLATRTRLSLRRVLSIAAVTAVIVSTFAVLDYQRDPDDRTHLGRFVAQLIDGQAWTVVSRKAGANFDVLTGSPVTWLIPIFAVAVWLVLGHRGRLRRFFSAEPGWRAGYLAAAAAVGIGALINDSGIAVPAVAGCVLVPVLIWVSLRWSPPGDLATGGPALDTPTVSAESGSQGVNVNSREPTG